MGNIREEIFGEGERDIFLTGFMRGVIRSTDL